METAGGEESVWRLLNPENEVEQPVDENDDDRGEMIHGILEYGQVSINN